MQEAPASKLKAYGHSSVADKEEMWRSSPGGRDLVSGVVVWMQLWNTGEGSEERLCSWIVVVLLSAGYIGSPGDRRRLVSEGNPQEGDGVQEVSIE